MSPITTHVLDTAQGRPAAGIPVVLEIGGAQGAWQVIGQGITDADGRLKTLLSERATLIPGDYRLSFDVAGYFHAQGAEAFYKSIVISFTAAPGQSHYHVPLLLSPFGYSTYRGS